MKLDTLRRLGAWLSASLPNRCLLCHLSIPAEHTGLCDTCLASTLYQGPVCLGCGRGLLQESGFCGSCQRLDTLAVVAPASYHHGLGSVIAAIKHRQQLAPLAVLCQLLWQRAHRLSLLGLIQLPQVLVPVPLHPKRQRSRGFNQAWLIAAELARYSGLPLDDSLVSRCLDTRPQEGLDGKARRRNLANAFSLNRPCPWQRIALVDDVVTTGATAREIAALFRGSGVAVQVWCLARAEAPGLLSEVLSD
ncbi:ComF family protein [Shewanella sedimentimangrovi]|uniref:ComF family protein n=1 Tax=Shewanella sedimentimangrovi TaxID=2814293 RepID=UPI001E45CB12|nr:ComF family protein [Shewanella sedimentimangrovi]